MFPNLHGAARAVMELLSHFLDAAAADVLKFGLGELFPMLKPLAPAIRKDDGGAILARAHSVEEPLLRSVGALDGGAVLAVYDSVLVPDLRAVLLDNRFIQGHRQHPTSL